VGFEPTGPLSRANGFQEELRYGWSPRFRYVRTALAGRGPVRRDHRAVRRCRSMTKLGRVVSLIDRVADGRSPDPGRTSPGVDWRAP
jgi:hypothetical protein